MRVIAGDVSIVTRKSVRPNGDKLGNDAWNIPRNPPHHPHFQENFALIQEKTTHKAP